MIKTLSSVVLDIESKKTPKAQAEAMKANSSKSLKDIIGYAIDPAVIWLLPKGDPPYRPLPESAEQEGKLYNETKRLVYFVDSIEGRGLTRAKREQMFTQLLESIDPRDAKLLLRVKDKSLKISTEAVKEAFPGIAVAW